MQEREDYTNNRLENTAGRGRGSEGAEERSTFGECRWDVRQQNCAWGVAVATQQERIRACPPPAPPAWKGERS